ncbi:hypothetical protein N7481_010283 [Penicillium waksmanii]|uniref:uncharacterized protein n=1 Tax=Penicillium waksmanii TaxID=69791 RepID=UPI002548267A|nr:uncharacterized protein N7481_010283 [Penicillium waksmanii]KAJ5976576.1 hypothetical protein N7481_010283 [Penicillium waksmanii]
MSDQANPVSSYWMNKLHAHVARVNANHNEDRSKKKRTEEMPSGKKPQGPFRVRDNDMERIKKRRHDAKRDRKVRFEGVPKNGSVDGSLPCQSDDFILRLSVSHMISNQCLYSSVSKAANSDSKSDMSCPETLAGDVKILARQIGTLKRDMEKMKQTLENMQ